LKTKPHPQRIGIVSLGCAKNLVDTERLMKQLDSNHIELISNPGPDDRIDAVIINTCGFINDAKQESIDTILQFVDAKKEGKLQQLYVMGCLSERYREQLKAEIPEVNAFFGVNELQKLVKEVGGTFKKRLLGERFLTTPKHYAYLKIAEGCDRKCSFCSIPLIRGKHLSRPMEEILSEAKNLVAGGVKELNVISQDTTYYGLDLYKKRMLPELLKQLAEIPGVRWIRLHYTYPDGFPMETLDIIRENPKICNYLDIPLQHISSSILKSMKRGIDAEGTMSLLEKIREKVPGIAVRSTLIVGYPGETEKDFRALKDFVTRARFERLGVFTYSHEEDTAAFGLKDNVPASVKRRRVDEIMEIQQGISFEINQEKIGQVFDVLIDRVEGDYFIGRTAFDSPEIDNEVLIRKPNADLQTGEIYPVKIFDADAFDLFGEIDLYLQTKNLEK